MIIEFGDKRGKKALVKNTSVATVIRVLTVVALANATNAGHRQAEVVVAETGAVETHMVLEEAVVGAQNTGLNIACWGCIAGTVVLVTITGVGGFLGIACGFACGKLAKATYF